LKRDSVEVRLLIKRADAPLRGSDTAHVIDIGLLGNRAIEILPGSNSARALKDQDTIQSKAYVAARHIPDSTIANIGGTIVEMMRKRGQSEVKRLK